MANRVDVELLDQLLDDLEATVNEIVRHFSGTANFESLDQVLAHTEELLACCVAWRAHIHLKAICNY